MCSRCTAAPTTAHVPAVPTRVRGCMFAALESMLGRFRAPDDPVQLEDLVRRIAGDDNAAAARFAENGRTLRNAIAHGYWDRDEEPLDHLQALLAPVLVAFLEAWVDGEDRDRRPARASPRQLVRMTVFAASTAVVTRRSSRRGPPSAARSSPPYSPRASSVATTSSWSELKAELSEAKAERDAARDYRYDAIKRLVHGPPAAAVPALGAVASPPIMHTRGLARTARSGEPRRWSRELAGAASTSSLSTVVPAAGARGRRRASSNAG